MELQGLSAQDAADIVMQEVGETTNASGAGGDGGVIVLDGGGRFAFSMNTPGMYRAALEADGAPVIRIFADEEP